MNQERRYLLQFRRLNGKKLSTPGSAKTRDILGIDKLKKIFKTIDFNGIIRQGTGKK
jgi:hypothetical protein